MARGKLPGTGMGSRWRGGRVVRQDGYVELFRPDHPRATPNGYVREHVIVAERALGKSLPSGAIVHHVDECRAHNTNDNLVVCQDRAYHALLHRRMRALAACGDPNARRCGICGCYNNQEDIKMYGTNKLPRHRVCVSRVSRSRASRSRVQVRTTNGDVIAAGELRTLSGGRAD